jgi:hypothetical protein
VTWYDYHLLAAHDARLETVLAEMQRLRRYGVTDWERTAGAAGWNEVVRYAREVRDALGVDDIMLEVLREAQRIKAATVSLPPHFLNEISAALDQYRWAVAYRSAALEVLSGAQRFLLSRRLRWRNLVSLLNTFYRSMKLTAPRRVRVMSVVRRALGFFSAAKVDGRNLP